MEPTGQTPQQAELRAAVAEVRRRYERGEITFDSFQHGLDALLLASTADECQTILRSLPSLPLAALNALEVPATRAPVPATTRPPRRKWLVAVIGEVKRLRRPWKLGERTLCLALLGEAQLDLSLAALPRHAVLRVVALVGEVVIYVPRSVHVTVRSLLLIGEVDALGERNASVFSVGHEESDAPAGGLAAGGLAANGGETETQLEIEALALVGEVRVVQVDGPVLIARGAGQAKLLPRRAE